MKSYTIVGYTTEDGMIFCFDCHNWHGVGQSDHPVFADSEWDYYPTCERCGVSIDDVCLTDDGREYENVAP